MAYIGKDLNDIATANIAVNTMIGNGSTTTMGISMGSKGVGSVNDVTVFVEGVRQTPGTDYTLSGSTLTFTTAPASGVKVVSMSHGDSWNNAPSDNTVTAAKLQDSAVTNEKIIGLDAGKLSGSLSGSGTNLTNLNAANLSGTLPAVDGSALTGITSYEKEATDPTGTENKPLGTMWVNKTTGEMYICTDATTDANVWTNVGDGSDPVPLQLSAASGGSVTTVGDYKIHTFTSSSQFIVSQANAPIEYLVIAGGGGGGADIGGGGGAGSYRTASSLSINAGTYEITVGAGGAGSTGGNTPGSVGSNSVFSTITSDGGGSGGYKSAHPGGNSTGSGGGSGPVNPPAGGGGTGGLYGNDGGDGTTNGGGGGGGAGSVGADSPSVGIGGAGGDGLASSITGSPVIRAGGGGGANYSGGGGAGGSSIGGNGGYNGVGSAGSTNTGSGGGGGGWNNYDGAAGGSGIVILRYKYQ